METSLERWSAKLGKLKIKQPCCAEEPVFLRCASKTAPGVFEATASPGIKGDQQRTPI